MFLLNSSNVVRYLVRSGRVSNPTHWEWRTGQPPNVGRWNGAFIAYLRSTGSEGEHRWFIKQPTNPIVFDSVGIDTEVQFYRLVHGKCPLSRYLPGFDPRLGYDAANRILVIEGLKGFEPTPEKLHNNNVNLRKGLFAAAVATMMGTFHQALDRVRLGAAHPPDQLAFSVGLPSLLREKAQLANALLGDAAPFFGRGLRRILTERAVAELLDELESGWRPSHLIHGDAGFRNILFRISETNAVELRWVDWETACWGDPRWDFALFFHDVLQAYLKCGYVNPPTFRHNCRIFWERYNSVQPEYPDFKAWCNSVLRLAVLHYLTYLVSETAQRRVPEAEALATLPELHRLFLDPLVYFDFP